MSFAITNRHALAAGASLFALCMGAQGALAQTGPSTEPEPGRDVVVIVGQTIEETLPQELARYGSVVETMTSEEIREGGYTDVSNALQMEVPGLFVAPRGGPFSYLDISLQGSRTQDILFLVDGVRINNRLYPGTITDTLPSSMVLVERRLRDLESRYAAAGSQAALDVRWLVDEVRRSRHALVQILAASADTGSDPDRALSQKVMFLANDVLDYFQVEDGSSQPR